MATVQEVDDAFSSLEDVPGSHNLGSVYSTGAEELVWEDIDLHPFIDFSKPNSFDYTEAHWKESNDRLDLLGGSAFSDGPRQCFNFLETFTRSPGFFHSFDCGTYHDREEAAKIGLEAHKGPTIQSSDSLKLYIPDLQNIQPMPHSFAEMSEGLMSAMCTSGRAAVPTTIMTQPSSLYWATHEIVLLIKEVVTVKPRNSPVEHCWSSVLETLCIQFFSPANLLKFLHLYWTIWHPNVNFVHRPTFDPTTCKPTLLATMALIGTLLYLIFRHRVNAYHSRSEPFTRPHGYRKGKILFQLCRRNSLY